MFNASGSSRAFGVDYGTPDRYPSQSSQRSSIGGSQFNSQQNSPPRGAAVEGKRKAPEVSEGGLPVTVGMLYKAARQGRLESGRCNIYGDAQCGVVILCGWVTSASMDETEPIFKIADGTSKEDISVMVDIRSDNEKWLRPLVKECVYLNAYVRLVANGTSVDGIPTLRGLNVRAATAIESSYYHTVQVIHMYLRCTGQIGGDASENTHTSLFTPSTNIGRTSLAAPIEPVCARPDKVDLPAFYQDTQNLCERSVIRCVIDNRKDDMGISVNNTLYPKLLAQQYSKQEIDNALRELEDIGSGWRMEGYFDIVVDEQVAS